MNKAKEIVAWTNFFADCSYNSSLKQVIVFSIADSEQNFWYSNKNVLNQNNVTYYYEAERKYWMKQYLLIGVYFFNWMNF